MVVNLKYIWPFVVFTTVDVAISLHFCSEFNEKLTNGVSGLFQMDIVNGSASYQYALNFSEFSTTCDLSKGLKWHIHSYWTNGALNSSFLSGCAATFTGGHYDPNLACGSSSQEYSGLCRAINRTNYYCNPTLFAAGHYSICEVGDLSGKFGTAYPKDMNGFYFERLSKAKDYLPPYAINYGRSDYGTHAWKSIVFHCHDNTRLVCALFIPSEQECSILFSESSSFKSSAKSSGNLFYFYSIGIPFLAVFFIVILVLVNYNLILGYTRQLRNRNNGDSTSPAGVQLAPGQSENDTSSHSVSPLALQM